MERPLGHAALRRRRKHLQMILQTLRYGRIQLVHACSCLAEELIRPISVVGFQRRFALLEQTQCRTGCRFADAWIGRRGN